MAKTPIGIPDDELIEIGAENTIVGVLQNFGNKLQDSLRKSLQSKVTTVTPKSLEQSIVFDVTFLGSQYSFELTMNDYWKFIDKGVQGAGGTMADGRQWIKKNNDSEFRFRKLRPPLDDIESWSRSNTINPFVAQRSVFRRGIEKTNFYSDIVDDKLIADLNKDLAKAGGREVAITLKKSFE